MELDGSWALLVSFWRDNQLEHTVAAVGSLSTAADGSPVFSVRGGGRIDDGRSLYAPQVALDPDGPWFLGWVMQVGDPGEATEDAVAGCLTLVRRLRSTVTGCSAGRPRQAGVLGEPVVAGRVTYPPRACRRRR